MINDKSPGASDPAACNPMLAGYQPAKSFFQSPIISAITVLEQKHRDPRLQTSEQRRDFFLAAFNAPQGFHPKRKTGLPRTFYAGADSVHVLWTKGDARRRLLTRGCGSFKKQGYVTTINKHTGGTELQVILTANDHTNTDGLALPKSIKSNIENIQQEERICELIHKVSLCKYVASPTPAQSIFLHTKEDKTGASQKRISLIRPVALGDATGFLGIQTCSTAQQLAIYLDALRGLHALEKAGYIHRDLKKDNILVYGDRRTRQVDRAEIADLGCAISLDNTTAATFTNRNYPKETNDPIWASRPFVFSDDRYALASMMTQNLLYVLSDSEFKSSLSGLLSRMRDKDLGKRPSAVEAIASLEKFLAYARKPENSHVVTPVRSAGPIQTQKTDSRSLLGKRGTGETFSNDDSDSSSSFSSWDPAREDWNSRPLPANSLPSTADADGEYRGAVGPGQPEPTEQSPPSSRKNSDEVDG